MKIKHLAVLAAFAAAAFTAQAQVATGVNDLVLGFKNAANTETVLVNLGNVNAFTTPGASAGTFNLGNLSAALTAAYGSDWATNNTTGVSWGVIGNAGQVGPATNGDPVKTAWATSKWDTTTAGTLGVQNSTAFNSSSSSALNTTNTKVAAIYAAMSGATMGQTSGNTVTLANGVWGTNAPFNLSAALFSGNLVTSLALGQSYSAADLNRIAQTGTVASGFDTGTFALYQDGTFTFTVVPEPSTYAAILGVMTMGIVMFRRRRSSAQLAEIA